jgi:hypothetical protein
LDDFDAEKLEGWGIEKPVQHFVKAARDMPSSWNWTNFRLEIHQVQVTDLPQSLEKSQMLGRKNATYVDAGAAVFYQQNKYGIEICINNDKGEFIQQKPYTSNKFIDDSIVFFLEIDDSIVLLIRFYFRF